MAPLPDYEDILGGFNKKYPLSVKGAYAEAKIKGCAETLAVTAHCWYKPNDPYLFASAISNPPGELTDKLSVARNCYGNGICVYSCGAIESGNSPNAQKAFASLIADMIEKPAVISDAPWQIEVQAFCDDEKIAVNLHYYGKGAPPVPVYGINVAVYIGEAKAESVMDVGLGQNIDYTVEDGYLKTRVSEVLYFNSLHIFL
jgi:hypothetical protein